MGRELDPGGPPSALHGDRPALPQSPHQQLAIRDASSLLPILRPGRVGHGGEPGGHMQAAAGSLSSERERNINEARNTDKIVLKGNRCQHAGDHKSNVCAALSSKRCCGSCLRCAPHKPLREPHSHPVRHVGRWRLRLYSRHAVIPHQAGTG